MSFPLPPRPSSTRRLRPGPRAGAARPKPAAWGWLEWFVISQTVLPALLFVPGISAVRTPIRAAAYLASPVAWYFVARKGGRPVGSASFPARPWLLVCIAWLGLSIFHPNGYSLPAAAAQAALYVAVLSPAFWAPLALTSTAQIRRLMTIFLLCNALSSAVGILQVFRPQTFNPPVIPAMNNIFKGEDLTYETDDGRKILRPCGLTDTPGGVAPAGMAAALIGLCWALLPIAPSKRLASLALAFLGIAVIYFTQVRFTFVMLAICMATLTALLLIQRDTKKAVLLTVLGSGLVVGAFTIVAISAGTAMVNRFMTLFTSDPGNLYSQSRGRFVQEAFDTLIWEYPLGHGMGWWGMILTIFADPSRPSTVWCEVMIPAWIYDGGIPLFVAYVGALTVTMLDSFRIARTCKDRELAYWATVIIAFNVGILATCFSMVAFLSPIGIPFWLLSAALHAADARTRLPAKAAS